jgi:hypothetical protein
MGQATLLTLLRSPFPRRERECHTPLSFLKIHQDAGPGLPILIVKIPSGRPRCGRPEKITHCNPT